MGKRGLKLQPTKPVEFYFILINDGEGLKHEYTINVTNCESGVLYEMYRSKTEDPIANYENKTIYSLLNNGNGYVLVDMDFPTKKYEYDEMFTKTLFFSFIQKIEANPDSKFYYEIHNAVIFHKEKI